MNLIPAIDLLDGRCVRLLHGDFNEVTWYEDTPEQIAHRYADAGAPWLHVVDLEASRDGESADSAPLFELLGQAGQKVQTGGGVRGEGDIQARLDSGADRVVVGSLSASEPDRFSSWLKDFGPEKLVAALDVQIDRNGIPWPKIYGWTEGAGMTLWQLMDLLSEGGLSHALITDIGRDGAMKGPNLELYTDIIGRYPQVKVQASGGVSSVDDLIALKDTGADSAIVGKALLDGAFTVREALEALK